VNAGTAIDTEAVIVGAGPCGLFAAFELGLLGIQAHVLETLDEPGGQCATLYPEKPIYDIPALPVVKARELVDRLLEQLSPFDTPIHLGQEVVRLEPADPGFRLDTSGALRFRARAVVIAGGIGSFQPRPLRVAGAGAHWGTSLHYRVTDRERFRGRRLLVLGGGDSALDWALDLHEVARKVTLVHRREAFRAAPHSVEKMKALATRDPGRMDWRVARVTALAESDGALTGVDVAPLTGGPLERIPCDDVLVFYGLSPSLGPIAEWGLALEKRQLAVDPETLQTSVPGIYAIGDINTYPGKKKLILSGFHEAAVAAYAVRKHLHPEVKETVQYTTTSSALKRRLGVTD
jgi:thioredoxin reductase (NADPH)